MIKKGDIVVFDGKHKLMCGDSRNENDVKKLMDNKVVDLVITDPPYGVNYQGIINDEPDLLDNLLNLSFLNVKNVLKAGGSIYLFHSDKMSHIFHNVFRKYFRFSSMLIWEKQPVLSFSDYNNMHEPIMYGWKDGTHKFYGNQKNHSILRYQRDDIYEHTTPKPVKLYELFIKNSSIVNDLILDCFGGSGTCLIACEKTQRICYMMELNEEYVENIIRRYYDYTLSNNIKIIREENIVLFNDIKEELKLLNGTNKKGKIDDSIMRLF